jgi:hypothetical protein
VSASLSDPSAGPSPASFHYGPGHLIVHGNGAFLEAFGPVVGQPAREALTALPPEAFELMDRVLLEGRALARWIRTPDGVRRLVVAPRQDPETGETYGVTCHVRRMDAPVRRSDP